MSALATYTYLAPDVPGLERLDIFDWEDINRAVQDVFLELAAEVQRRWPHIQSRPGKTLTHLLLFSYCAFGLPSSPDVDAVIAGIDFARSRTGQRIVVRADLTGEDSGTVWFALPEQEVAEDQDALRSVGEELARQLSAKADDVHAALHMQDPGACP